MGGGSRPHWFGCPPGLGMRHYDARPPLCCLSVNLNAFLLIVKTHKTSLLCTQACVCGAGNLTLRWIGVRLD